MDTRQDRTLACIARSRAACNATCTTPSMTQLVVRIPDDMARAVDALVDTPVDGEAVGSRSEAIPVLAWLVVAPVTRRSVRPG